MQQQRNKMIHTNLDIFERDILFFFGDYKKVIEFAKEEEVYEEELFDIDEKTHGRTILTGKGYTVCWIKDKTAHHYIAHEIFHCVDLSLRAIGVTLSLDSDEVYAYCIQSLTKQVYDEINKKNPT